MGKCQISLKLTGYRIEIEGRDELSKIPAEEVINREEAKIKTKKVEPLIEKVQDKPVITEVKTSAASETAPVITEGIKLKRK